MDAYEKYVGVVFDGRYKIEKIIGVGGMAVVFLAYDILMNRRVAVKMLKEEIAGDEESVKRFVNESKAVAMMSHRNIVSIYDVNVRKDVKYIVMEYIEGITLRNYMSKRGKLTLREIISYTEQILSALSHAHSKGIVHRDIKPQNIMLLKNGIIKVTDFGIAKLAGTETVTMTDKAIGTVYYISPEQASGQPIDNRSDLYSLGVMMYEMATGELPFTADSPVSVAMMQINDTAKAPGELNPGIPKGLEQIIGIAMEKKPAYRYQSAEDMLRQIQRLKENPNVVFRVPKHKDGDEQKGIMALLCGGGPMFPVIAAVALAFIIVFSVGTAFVLGRIVTAMTQTSETITVDDFVGHEFTDELSDWFESSDTYKLNVEYVYSEDYAPGLIIEQSPKANSSKKVVRGEQLCELTLKVCSGQQESQIPSLAGLDYREAKQKLKKLSISCNVEYKKSDKYFSGQVIGTNPEEGTKVGVGEKITLYVCSGKEDGEIELPSFKGMTEKEAFAKLLELELQPGKITYVKDEAKRGTVISQTDEEGTKVSLHAKINLTVSGGPDYDPDDPEGKNTTAPDTTKAPDTTPKAPVTTPKPDTTEDVSTEDETFDSESSGSDSDSTAPEDDILPVDKTDDSTKE